MTEPYKIDISAIIKKNDPHPHQSALGQSLVAWGNASDEIAEELKSVFSDPERIKERQDYEEMYLRLTDEEKVDESNIQNLYNVLPSLLIMTGISNTY